MWHNPIGVTCCRVLAVVYTYVTVFCGGHSQEATTMISGFSDFCVDPGVPEHAIRNPPVGVGIFYAGSKVRYTCEENYKLKGSPVLQCVAGGAWYEDMGAPSCVAIQECRLPTILQGFIWGEMLGEDRNSFKPGGVAHVGCYDRFYLSDESLQENRCQKNGKWANPWPQCLVGCGKPPDVEQSTHYISADYSRVFKQGTTATYRCTSGYTIIGDAQLQCGEDGTWKGTQPTCERFCQDKPTGSIENGYFLIHGEVVEANEYKSGTQVLYYCNLGYSLVGDTKLICRNGAWVGMLPKCMKACSMPKSSPHGYIITSRQTFPVGSTVRYSCEEGYRLEGDCHTIHINECERECLGSGSWSGSPPVCISMQLTGYCSDPGTPAHGTRCCQDTFQSGDKLSFYCNEGYEKTGSSERTCLNDGTWSGSQPVCYPARASITAAPQVDGIFLTNTTLTIVIATTGTVLGVLIIVILLSIRQCHYRNRRMCRSLPMRHSHRRANFTATPEDIDRVALIAYANGLEVVLPSYEEATASGPRSRPPSFTETSPSAPDNNNSAPAPPLPGPVPLTPRAHSSRFRLPRIPRSLRVPPPPPLSVLDNRQDHRVLPSVHAGHSAEAGVQTQDSGSLGDRAPSSGDNEQEGEALEDDRTADTAGLLLLENEIAQVSSRPDTDATTCTNDPTEEDDEPLLTDLGGPAEEAPLENVESEEAVEAIPENSQPPVNSLEERAVSPSEDPERETPGNPELDENPDSSPDN